MNDPWGEDATQWNAWDFAKLTAFGGPEMLDFCQGEENGSTAWHLKRKCILVGRRGLGKSFLLAHRSYHHREYARHSIFFHPHGGNPENLVEVLTLVSGGIPKTHWLRTKSAADSWSALWQISIFGLLAWRLNTELSALKGFSEIFSKIEELDVERAPGDAESGLQIGPLQWFLGRVIENAPSEREECQSRLDKWLFNATLEWAAAIIRALARSNRQRIVIYLDNPDELIPLAETDVWTNVQQGLVLAIWKLRKGGPLTDVLHIFASVRSEAVSQRVHADLQHALGLAIYLHYDREMLKKMFVNLCALTDKQYLAKPELHDADPAQAFLGITEITHQDRHTPTGVRQQEPVLDALIRHTRCVPRELVGIGRKIKMLPVSERNEKLIRSAANSAAEHIVKYIKENCFPPWSREVETMLENFDCQVIAREELFHCEGGETAAAVRMDAVRYLVSLGLLGYAEAVPERHRHYYLQRFTVEESYGRSASAALQRDFFFLHPALKEWVRANRIVSRPWRSVPVLIGDALPYEPAPPLLRLGIFNGRPTVQIKGNIALQPMAGRHGVGFLFLALCAWKLRGGGAVWPTIADINVLKGQLTKAHTTLGFPHIAPDQSQSGSPVRNWARKINEEEDLKQFSSYSGPDRRADISKAENGKPHDRRRTGFISVSAASDSGADARIGFPCLDAKDIYIEEDIRHRIRLS